MLMCWSASSVIQSRCVCQICATLIWLKGRSQALRCLANIDVTSEQTTTRLEHALPSHTPISSLFPLIAAQPDRQDVLDQGAKKGCDFCGQGPVLRTHCCGGSYPK